MKRKCMLSAAALMIIGVMTGYAQNAPAKKKVPGTLGPSYTTSTKPAPKTVAVKGQSSTAATKPAVVKKTSAGSNNPIRFGVNLEPALPLGNLKLASNFGFGVNGMVKYRIAGRTDLKGSLGYMTFPGKTVTEEGLDGNGNPETVSFKPGAIHAVTIKGGGAYMLTDRFFVQGSIGLAFLNHGGGTAFLYTPGVGYMQDHIELLFKYEGWSKDGGTLSFLGLQLGYNF